MLRFAGCMVCFTWWFLKAVVGHSSTTPLGMADETMARQLALQEEAMKQWHTQQQQVSQPVFQATQSLWFEQRRSMKRGPPSAMGISSTGLSTPQVASSERADTDMPETAPAAPSSSTTPQTSLFQPLQYDSDAATQLTAAECGVNPNDPEKVREWLATPIQTRQDVMDTIRGYHVGVIRGEMYNLVSQIGNVIKALDDRMLKQQEDLFWLTSECRIEQKRSCGLQVLLTGWDPAMNPTERHFMVNWMLQQVSFIRTWLQRRGVSDFDPESVFFNVLQVDPATPPSGSQWSTITILTFKAWDLREKFMADFGGATGTALWKDSRTQVKGRHIRATPCSPQFQRKLEIPIRVLLSLINESKVLESSQVVILWKTLTIMAPQTVRAFDPQAVACARLHYFEKDGVFRARLEIADSLWAACEATPPVGSAETCMWNYSWNKVVFGVQSEIDAADKAATEAAMKAAYASGHSARVGKPNRHWTQGFVYSSETNPYPVEIDVVKVPQVAYCWDEYCDRMDPTKKVGDYSASTFCGPPILSAQAGRTEMAAPNWVPARSSQQGS